jgi:hypothetical protein
MRQKSPILITLLGLSLLLPSLRTTQAGPCELPSYMMFQNLTNTSTTTLVTIQNLTPYEIELVGDGGLRDWTGEFARQEYFAMVPNGLPSKLPPSRYAPNPKDGFASPIMPIIFAYQDSDDLQHPGNVTEFKVKYRIKSVCALDKQRVKRCGDVDLILHLHRQPAPKYDAAGNIPLMADQLAFTWSAMGVVMDPKNPMAWVKFAWSTFKEVKNEGFSEKNMFHSEANLWIGAYATQKDGCYPGGIFGKACSDSLVLQAPEMCGTPATDIVIMMMAFRGKYGGDGEGVVPRTIISVLDFAHYHAAGLKGAMEQADRSGAGNTASFSHLSAQLAKSDTAVGLLRMAEIMGDFTPEQRLQLVAVVQKIYDDQPLDEHETLLLNQIADGL